MLLKRKLPRIDKNNQGVTLIEVIAVVAVLGVVMAAVTGFMITGAKMSAQASGGATAGMREQTATEYINQRLWEAAAVSVDTEQELLDQNGEKTGWYPELILIMENGSEMKLTTQENASNAKMVTYNGTELCKGEIYFKKIENNTVIYVLNDTEHVVHLRIGS